jgi:hypothetical protein
MACIHREIPISAAPEVVWAAVRDVGNVHERLVPGVLVDAYLDDDSRVVTFANGAVIRELIVDLDDAAKRFAYAVTDGPLQAVHHHATMQVVAAGPRDSTLIWTTDVVPDELAAPIAELVDQGAAAMSRTLART